MFPAFLELPLTYLFTGLFICISVVAFYYKPLYHALIYHPYEVFKGKRLHSTVTSAFIHTSWKHLLFNTYLFYLIARDVEYIILEKDYSQVWIKFIYLTVFLLGIAGPNLVQGWKERNNIHFTNAGASACLFTFIAFSMLYLPLDHPKRPHKFIPLYYGYEFFAFFLIGLILLAVLFKKSKTNHNAHLIGFVIGTVLAIILRPVLFNEIFHHLFDSSGS